MDKKIMLHIIMPNQISGPNKASRLIANSYLKNKYVFEFLTQEFQAGGRINVRLIYSLYKQIKKFNPDLVQINGLLNSGFHAVIAAKISRKKILLVIRGSAIDDRKISKFKKIFFEYFIEPVSLLLSDKVITVSEAMAKREYIRKYSKKSFVNTIHNSIPTNINTSDINLRDILNIDIDDIIVVIVGRIVYDKGITFIIEAIKSINRNNIKFVFIGEENDKKNLFKNMLKDEIKSKKVFFMGNQNDVLSLLTKCDIFLFATLHENLSNALLEASLTGLSIIATNVGGNPEVIINNYNGLLIEKESSIEIINKILYLSDNPEIRKLFGNNAKKHVINNFSQEVLLPKYVSLYNSIFVLNENS